jgi:hypothetical protein
MISVLMLCISIKQNNKLKKEWHVATKPLKVHKIEIFFGFDFEISIISLLVMSKY